MFALVHTTISTLTALVYFSQSISHYWKIRGLKDGCIQQKQASWKTNPKRKVHEEMRWVGKGCCRYRILPKPKSEIFEVDKKAEKQVDNLTCAVKNIVTY